MRAKGWIKHFRPVARKTTDLTFSEALEEMKLGNKVARERWGHHGNNIYIGILEGGEYMTEPYIYMYKEVEGKVVTFPTPLSCESLLANDWKVV